LRDLVLEGASAPEVLALLSIYRGLGNQEPAMIGRLHAKGWIDVLSDEPVLTIAGNCLIQAHLEPTDSKTAFVPGKHVTLGS